MSSVYLAGPIQHKTVDEATIWRDVAARHLELYGIKSYSPMRGREEPDGKPIAVACLKALSSDHGITARDRFDVMRCDVVLANFLGAKQASCGTPIEFGWADAFRKPVIMVIEEKGNPFDHPMMGAVASYRVTTLALGLELCKSLLA